MQTNGLRYILMGFVLLILWNYPVLQATDSILTAAPPKAGTLGFIFSVWLLAILLLYRMNRKQIS